MRMAVQEKGFNILITDFLSLIKGEKGAGFTSVYRKGRVLLTVNVRNLP